VDGQTALHWRGLVGAYDDCPYIPADAVAAVRASHWKQAAVYAAALLLSLLAGNGLLLWLWLLPLALGQPLLRFVLLAEHGGCSTSTDGLRNTRTTHTLAPLRWLMWNMPFHSEHHLFASIPFHALPAAHPWIAADLEHNDPGLPGGAPNVPGRSVNTGAANGMSVAPAVQGRDALFELGPMALQLRPGTARRSPRLPGPSGSSTPIAPTWCSTPAPTAPGLKTSTGWWGRSSIQRGSACCS